jgi:DNA-binding SARP family transcriptional activator/tetratricopeptide (TPR) repeat protein
MVGGEPRSVQGLRRKAVLAVLGLHAGEVVSTGRLVELVWDGAAPPNAVNALQSHLSYLRRTLSDKTAVRSRPPGYVLDVGADGTDVALAERLIGAGLRDNDRDHAARARDLQSALSLWRGQPMADATGVSWIEEQAERLGQLWLQGKRALLSARLELGQHGHLLPELEQLTREHPFDEQLHGQLILALYRMGRQADALSAFQRLRRTLRDDLGIEPGPALRELESAMLRQDTQLDPPPAPIRLAPEPERAPPAERIPAQIPLAVRTFAGRAGQLARLDALLPSQWTPPGSAVFVAVVSGTAGVGKSALAVHWAHRVADRFPDGQLYVNLRGFDPANMPMPPADAVRGFLDALGVPAERIPADLPSQAGLLRSQLSGKRVLILLDNARDAEQVRPLLPATPGCLAVVTSRDPLTSLVAIEGAVPVPVDLLTDAEARDLLVSRLGARRVAAEPAAVERIVVCCARLPLALAVVAGRAATRPERPLAALAEEIGERRSMLDAIAGSDPASDARAVFSWSYRALSPGAAAVLRRMSLGPGPDLGIDAVASLAGVPAQEARTRLAELDRAGLVVEHRPGRYTFHDLLRAYATELVETHDGEPERGAALHRLLEHYLATAQAAAQRLDPARDPAPRAAMHPAIAVPQPPREEAQAWFADEHRCLLAAIRLAAERGMDEHTWRLAAAMATFLDWHGQWQELVMTQEAALRALRRLGDRPGQGAASCELGQVYARVGRFDEAHQYLWTALCLYEQLDDAPGLARAHYHLGWLQHAQRRYRDALSHSEQALQLFERIGDKLWRARALNATGWIMGQLGEYERALRRCRDALVENREVGDRHGEAGTWDAVGYAHHRLGDPRQAIACYGHALRAYRELGDRSGQACVLSHLGDAHAAAGDPAAAAEAWRHSLAILDELDPAQAATVRAKLPADSPGQAATVRG